MYCSRYGSVSEILTKPDKLLLSARTQRAQKETRTSAPLLVRSDLSLCEDGKRATLPNTERKSRVRKPKIAVPLNDTEGSTRHFCCTNKEISMAKRNVSGARSKDVASKLAPKTNTSFGRHCVKYGQPGTSGNNASKEQTAKKSAFKNGNNAMYADRRYVHNGPRYKSEDKAIKSRPARNKEQLQLHNKPKANATFPQRQLKMLQPKSAGAAESYNTVQSVRASAPLSTSASLVSPEASGFVPRYGKNGLKHKSGYPKKHVEGALLRVPAPQKRFRTQRDMQQRFLAPKAARVHNKSLPSPPTGQHNREPRRRRASTPFTLATAATTLLHATIPVSLMLSRANYSRQHVSSGFVTTTRKQAIAALRILPSVFPVPPIQIHFAVFTLSGFVPHFLQKLFPFSPAQFSRTPVLPYVGNSGSCLKVGRGMY